MVWERYVGVIIMLVNIYESDQCIFDDTQTRERKKCEVYWPEKPGKINYGGIEVTLVNEFDMGDFIVRQLVVETVSFPIMSKPYIYSHNHNSKLLLLNMGHF
jgi:hypothetical protein